MPAMSFALRLPSAGGMFCIRASICAQVGGTI
jgi:hypothetical protein